MRRRFQLHYVPSQKKKTVLEESRGRDDGGAPAFDRCKANEGASLQKCVIRDDHIVRRMLAADHSEDDNLPQEQKRRRFNPISNQGKRAYELLRIDRHTIRCCRDYGISRASHASTVTDLALPAFSFCAQHASSSSVASHELSTNSTLHALTLGSL
ncbi:hypothetical protein CLCR_07710 [Cladophialophora carrionii]|uniref:Uncharacterized protein n=1 Tax=Cladophialophora carrionii TaxID=86049 RepID=A0A1C1CMP0_9EURO|nr:hypothetical protein CLCR_07710 [Cladophialophora carrionii]